MRTIYDLVEAEAAREPLSAADVERLKHNEPRLRRLLLLEGPTSPWWRRFKFTGFNEFRAQILRDRDRVLSQLKAKKATPGRRLLREIIDVLLSVIEIDEILVADLSGEDRRNRQRLRSASQKQARANLQERDSLLAKIDTMRARNPSLSYPQAVRNHLFHTDPDWGSKSDGQQATKIETLTRNLRRHRARNK